MSDANSVLNYYRKLISLWRELDTLRHGSFMMLLSDHRQLFAYERALNNDVIMVICNFSNKEIPVPPEISVGEGEVLLSNSLGDYNTSISPYGAIVVKKKSE